MQARMYGLQEVRSPRHLPLDNVPGQFPPSARQKPHQDKAVPGIHCRQRKNNVGIYDCNLPMSYYCDQFCIYSYAQCAQKNNHLYSPMTVVNKERNNKTQLDKANKAIIYYTKAHAQQPVHQQYFCKWFTQCAFGKL